MNVEILRGIKKLITHKNATGPCPDGVASALIVKDALPNVEVVFVSYGSPEYEGLVPEPGVLFCDIVPHAERDREAPHLLTERGFAQARAWVDADAVVLDHHKGVADLVAMFGERGVYADAEKEPGVSGAVLAFREVWELVMTDTRLRCGRRSAAYVDLGLDLIDGSREIVQQFAALAGVRDTWQTASATWQSACEQAAALCFWPSETMVAVVRQHGWSVLVDERLAVGGVLLQQQRAQDDRTIAESGRFECVSGLQVACFEGDSRSASDVAERLRAEGVDLVFAWHYHMKNGDAEGRLKFSCRSRKGGFDCAALAASHGGNGHQPAAGFEVVLGRDFDARDPYRTVVYLLSQHLDRLARST